MRLNLHGITPISRKPIRKSIFVEREMCWDAVVLCAHRSGALSKAKYKQLWQTVFDKQYKHFVSPDDTEIRTMADMLRAPQGMFYRHILLRDAAAPRLLHAMIGTGRDLPQAIKIFASAWGRGRLGKSQSGARSALAA